jgi:L-rhamnose mutarotase
MASDQITAEWWKLLKPMQQPMVTEKKEEWWTNMEIIFQLD